MGATSEQLPLGGFGPDAGDRFRFDWLTTPIGAEVWVEHRAEWVKGRIAGRGRKYVVVAIATQNGRRRHVRKLYSELRRASG